jgi:hypothetical protein
LTSSHEQEAARGVTGIGIGDFAIQDVTGVMSFGSEEEMRAEWMERIETNTPHEFDEIALVEVKAVIRK